MEKSTASELELVDRATIFTLLIVVFSDVDLNLGCHGVGRSLRLVLLSRASAAWRIPTANQGRFEDTAAPAQVAVIQWASEGVRPWNWVFVGKALLY
jgi:hypothetical protein